ncbi:hypothetical protein DFQ28_011222 [Apophysomyces sp. BC1034]|nr:hypothetical protein DFQ30_002181 [Apophysomyces sp. BC1015]KAG0194421.1 hypothetical protein DFQ28_011222 [Apophysomyces sp. BC1034]
MGNRCIYSLFDLLCNNQWARFQARRTGTSSPLGELFDHGCDALNCSFAAVLQATALGMGHSMSSIMLYSIAMLGFYLSTAEEYHTGILYLGYVNAPTEGVILSCIIFTISSIYGPSVWQNPVGETIKASWLPTTIATLPWSQALVWWVGLLLIFTHCPVCFYAMYKACRAHNKPFLKTMVMENLPIATYVASFFFWVTSPYSFILTNHHFILFAITTGIVFGRMATKIILAHLTKSTFPKFTVLMIPLIGGAIITNLPRLNFISPIFTAESEFLYISGFFVFALLAYLRWAVVVINSFCSYLNIRCLVIPKQTKAL